MELELLLLRSFTTRLPRMKGAGRIANYLRRFYARRPRDPVAADVRGMRLRLRPDEFVDSWLLFGPQFYEHEEIRFLELALGPGDVFLDVGAHLGLYALVGSRAVGSSGRVVAIEADPDTAADLRHNVSINGASNVLVLGVGVSDRHERRRLAFRTPGNRAGNSFLFAGGRGVEVDCFPLLDLLRGQGIAQVDGLKIDVEGFEHRVLAPFLRDAEAALLPRFVITEFYPEWLDAAGGDAIGLLERHGYRLRERHGANYVLTRA